jgi:hypothetical protein
MIFACYELFAYYSHLSEYVPVDTDFDENVSILLLFIKTETEKCNFISF